MQFQHCCGYSATTILCLCRKSSTILIADIASISLVMLWLMYIIHVTLKENQEDAQNMPRPARISEFLKVNALYHHPFIAGVRFASQCHAVSPCMCLVVVTMQTCASQMLMHAANHVRCLCKLAQLTLHISCASTHMSAYNTWMNDT